MVSEACTPLMTAQPAEILKVKYFLLLHSHYCLKRQKCIQSFLNVDAIELSSQGTHYTMHKNYHIPHPGF